MKFIKKILIVLIIILGLTSKTSIYKVTSYKDSKKIQSNSNILMHQSIYLNIYKLGENNEFLSGVNFKLRSYNNTYEWDLTEDSENELYLIDYYIDKNISSIDNLLSKSQKELIDSIKTVSDIESKSPYYDKSEEISNEVGPNYDEYNIILPTYFILEETNVPSGYLKDKVYIPGTVSITYETRENDNVELTGVALYNNTNNKYLKYDEYDEDALVGTNIEKVINLWNNYEITSNDSCENLVQDETIVCDNCNVNVLAPQLIEKYQQFNQDNQVNQKQYNGKPGCYLTLKNIKGEISLSVENKVNETTSLTTTNNTNLTYKVILKNTGNVDAIDNTLTSKIPEGFEYIEGSASDGGVYKDGEIIWNVKRLEQGKDKTFTFRVHVPKGTDLSKSYIGESSVTNSSMQNRVESEKTVVKLSLINPNTLAPITIISVVLISLILLIVQALKYNKNKLHTKI